jgi:hypothetical protein
MTEIKLLSYQIPHKYQIHESLITKSRVLDGSDTGAGKTYVAMSECKDLKLRPFIICPKSVIPVWIEVAKYFDVQYFGISNYEMLKNCRYYTENYESTKCPYMDVEFVDEIKEKPNKTDNTITNYAKNISKINTKKEEKEDNKKKIPKYTFYLPDDVIVIFDEAHRCKNMSSITNKLLIGLSKCKNKIMILSATITDKIECFKPFGIFFGFYNESKQFNLWINNKKKQNIEKYKNNQLSDDLIQLDIIHNAIYPQYGSRIKISELGDLFPQNTITANCYYLENHNEVEKIYSEINSALEQLKKKESYAQQLAELIYARMKIEMLKVPLFIDLTLEGLENGYSVVIFVNYVDTLNYICYNLKDVIEEYGGIAVIMGGQSIDERHNNIQAFQNNSKKLMIAMIQAGGVGVSLHDIHGNHPRMSIISPPWAGDVMRQCLGRIHRANAKTPTLQKIVYVAKTYEEEMCKIIKQKLLTIDAINDGDLIGKVINKEVFDEIREKDDVDIINNDNNGDIKEKIIIPVKKKFVKSKKDNKKTL